MKEWIKTINDLFGISADTSATIFITLAVFLIGYTLNLVALLIKDFAKRYGDRQSIKEILSEIGESAYCQYTYFDEFILKTDMDTVSLSLKFTVINHLSTIKEVSYKEFKQAFTSRFKPWRWKRELTRVNAIYKSVYSLDQLEGSYRLEFKEYQLATKEYEDDWNETLEELRKLYDEVRLKTSGLVIKKGDVEGNRFRDFLLAADKIWVAYQKAEARMRKLVTMDVLLKPLLELSKHSDSKSSLVFDTINFCLNGLLAYENLDIRHRANMESVKSYRDHYRKIARNLIKI